MSLPQDTIRPSNDCLTTGGEITCPADALLEFDGVPAVIRTDITCPLSSTDQSNFREVSQEGLCRCSAFLDDLTENAEVNALDCPVCFICPESANQFGIAFQCNEPVFLQCTSFNCAGECNGELSLFAETRPPTVAPVEELLPSAANAPANLGVATACFVLALVRMIRH